MQAVRPLTITLSIMDTLVINTALLAFADNDKYNEIDREAALILKERIDKAMQDNCIEIERGD